MNLQSKKVAIVGYGVEGKAAAGYALAHGAEITICDSSNEVNVPDEFTAQLGSKYLDNLGSFDLVFRSPSINPSLLKEAKIITSNTNWFLANTPGFTIGVTGSKGKGTTSTLVHELLQVIGVKSWLAGNVGKAALEILDDVKQDEIVVLEMSSFQLIDANKSPDIAVCLMIEPDHMNWHDDMGEYIDAKANITLHQDPNNVFIYHPSNKNVQKIVAKSPARKVPFGEKPLPHVEGNQIFFLGKALIDVSQVGMIGKHNLENICAALTVIEQSAILKNIDLSDKRDVISSVIRDFKGLEHRLEFVREVDNVAYYNDSFAVMPDAAIAGINAFKRPVIAIAGGVDKKVPLAGLAKSLAGVKHVIMIGEIAQDLAELLEEQGSSNYQIVQGSMAEIVNAASAQAEPGDVVLLSPGTSSFDMFDSYKHRGELFKQAVHNL